MTSRRTVRSIFEFLRLAVALALVTTLGAYARPPVVVAASSPFTDIAGSTFEADIDWLWAQKITTGCDATHYCPNDPVTRAQMASFLVRMFKLPATTTDYFTDDETSTHEADINALAAAGITTGCSATTFCPKDPVTRGEMASFLARSIPLTVGAGRDYFRDDNRSTHEPNIDRIAAAGITTGCSRWRFCPIGSTTRAEMAGFLHRVVKPVTPPPYPAPSGPLYVGVAGSDTANDCLANVTPCRTVAHAIAEAGPGDTIRIGPGTYNEGYLTIDKDLHILGDDAGGTILDASGGPAHSIFDIQNYHVELANLTLTGGDSPGFYGGAISSSGFLTIIDSTIHHNRAIRGGAIFTVGGSLTVIGSTIHDNQALGGDGGAILYRGDLTLINTTLFGNEATEAGGGIAADGCGCDLTIMNSTISGNSAAGGGGVTTYGASAIKNSVIAGNSASYNWDDFLDAEGTATTLASIIGIPAGLTLADILDPAGLADNGGPTKTIALTDSAKNPALDKGDAATCAEAPVNGLDQRGLPRTPPCDIGAYEFQP